MGLSRSRARRACARLLRVIVLALTRFALIALARSGMNSTGNE